MSRLLPLAVACLAAGCQAGAPAPQSTPAASAPAAGPTATASGLPPGHPPLGGAPAPGQPAGELPPGHPPLEGQVPAAGPSEAPVAGQVTLSSELAGRAAGAKTLYVIARGAGTRSIVAVARIDNPLFPAAFELGPKDAMAPGTPFKGPFDLVARLSHSGDAMPAAGDLEGITAGVRAGTRTVRLTLDSVRR